MSVASPSLEQTRSLAASYAAAWNAHDVDALTSMQSDGMVFHLHLEGSEPTSGVEALRGLYGFFFAAMPDYRAEIKRERLAEGFFVWEYTISATLAQPFPIGEVAGKPTGQTARFDAVDVISCSDGKVETKDTYVDGFAMHRGMAF